MAHKVPGILGQAGAQGMRMTPETALTEFGFTDFESLLYCELLRQGPQTGYRLAQLVAKAPANTYQALKALAQKGAVVVSEGAGESKTYRPVAPEELLSTLSQTFEARRDEAIDAFSAIEALPTEERVYQLQTVSQTIERAHTMLATAEQIVLFDFFPPIFELMRDSIRRAQDRGVMVAGIAYEADHAEPSIPHNPTAGQVISELWPGNAMVLVADASQMLVSQLSRDLQELLNGIWTDSVFLSATYHSALAAEICLVALKAEPPEPLRNVSLFRGRPPGLERILRETEFS